MSTINEHIKIYDYATRKRVVFSDFVFPGGEVHVKDIRFISDKLLIYAHLRSSTDIVRLLLLVNAIKNIRKDPLIDLVLPYIPYSRQDRIALAGEALGIRVFSDLINSCNFNSVTAYDPHSFVSSALINNFREIPQAELLEDVFEYLPGDYARRVIVIAPDAGAVKKAQELARRRRCHFAVALKHRDTDTGEISETTIDLRKFEDTNGKIDRDCLIVDDICDGGRTFIELGKLLKTKVTGKIMLAVVNGIFSKGLEVFDGYIDHIFTPVPWNTVDSDFVTVLNNPLDPNFEERK